MTRYPMVFRVRTSRRRGAPYFTVRVCRTVAEMYAEVARDGCCSGHRRSWYQFLALCHGHMTVRFGPRGGQRVLPSLGIIWFAEPYTGASTISHEMTHATFRWAERVGLRVRSRRLRDGQHIMADAAEERFCQVHGGLVRQFWNAYYRRRRMVVRRARLPKSARVGRMTHRAA